jgi:hypothetical protein
MHAMTFERLVRDKRFASELATTAVGRLGLARTTKLVLVNARVNVERTAELLAEANARAIHERAATMLHGFAIPFAGFEGNGATDVKPDFAVLPRPQPKKEGENVRASWLIVGDAKDYERVRSRIDDARLLKGFLQLALGTKSAYRWTQLLADMSVHRYGALTVPRTVFLQPEALVGDRPTGGQPSSALLRAGLALICHRWRRGVQDRRARASRPAGRPSGSSDSGRSRTSSADMTGEQHGRIGG